MSIDDQLYDVSNKIRIAQFDNDLTAIEVLETTMDRLLDSKYVQMHGGRR